MDFTKPADFRADYNDDQGWASTTFNGEEIRYTVGKMTDGGGNFSSHLCRMLVEAGHPDGSLEFVKNGVPHFRIGSIHRWATKIIMNNQIIDFAPVKSDDDTTKENPVATIPEHWYTLLREIDSGDLIGWNAVHGKTKNSMIARGFVTAVPELTEAGEQAMVEYEEVHGRPDELAPRVLKAAEIAKVAPIKKDWYLDLKRLSGKRGASHWAKLHGKTKNAFINKGWVKLNGGSTPEVTSAGQALVTEYEALKGA